MPVIQIQLLIPTSKYKCIAKLENQVDWPILRSHSSCVMSEIHAELELLWMELAPTDLHHAEEAKRK